jgi:hypothetical protein
MSEFCFFMIVIVTSFQEESALHECLTWGSQPGNNPILRWFGPELADFDAACRRLMASFGTVLPEGSLKARIRCTTRESKEVKDETLGDTLGGEAEGLVMVDFQGYAVL